VYQLDREEEHRSRDNDSYCKGECGVRVGVRIGHIAIAQKKLNLNCFLSASECVMLLLFQNIIRFRLTKHTSNK
jgi:hypothetical protein